MIIATCGDFEREPERDRPRRHTRHRLFDRRARRASDRELLETIAGTFQFRNSRWLPAMQDAARDEAKRRGLVT